MEAIGITNRETAPGLLLAGGFSICAIKDTLKHPEVDMLQSKSGLFAHTHRQIDLTICRFMDTSPATCPNYPAFIYISKSSVPLPRHRFMPVRRENAINEA